MRLKKISLAMLLVGLANQGFASESGVVISQIFGGNGVTYNRDYVELFNAGTAAVNLNGWSLQYASAAGTGSFSTNGVTTLSGVLQPGQYYLIGLASATAGATLPATDAGPGSTNLSASNGKVALVNTTTGLTCNGSSTPCSSTQLAQIVDLVGYGTANFSESTPASALTTSTALLRANDGCTDTNNNGTDFTTGTPAPRNSTSPLKSCSTGAGTGTTTNQAIVPVCSALSVQLGQAGAVQLSASDPDSIVNAANITAGARTGIALGTVVAATADGGSAQVELTVADTVPAGTYPVTVTFANNEAQTASCQVSVSVQNTPITRIYTIQGADLGVASVSPLNGQTVTTEGVVSAVFPGLNGFYLQDATGDGNPLTSDGVFVYMGAGVTPTVKAGQKIRLTATVTEFNTLTELINPSNLQTLVAAGNPPTPVDIQLPEVVEGDLEAYEGMLVRIVTPLTASQNYFQGRFGQVTLSADGRLMKPTNQFAANSAEALTLADENARRRILLDDGTTLQNPNPIPYIGTDNTLRAGDVVENLTGVIDHGLITATSTGPRDYKIHPTTAVQFIRQNNRTASPPNVGGNLKVASFNVLNYFTTFTNGATAAGQTGQGCSLDSGVSAANCRGADNAVEFTRQRNKIVSALAAINADIVGLMEIQNNGSVAVQNLVDGVNALVGAGTYARVPDPSVGTGTDTIKVAMIYKPGKVTLTGAALSDTNSINNRPTLAQTFTAINGEKFSVLVNHLKSKSCSGAAGVDQDQNDGQGCYNDRRIAQATQLLQFIKTVQNQAKDPDVLLIGDMNAYGKEDPILTLNNGGIEDQIARFNGQTGYSYVFDGESGYLDHGLANTTLASQISYALQWHINADEPFVIDYNTEFKPQDLYSNSPYRSSDHDPVVVGLKLVKSIQGTAQRDSITGSAGDDVITGGIGADTLTGGAGNDVFVYQSMRDAVDTITDFTPGQDQIDIRQLLSSLGYQGSNPVADGVVRWESAPALQGSQLLIDADGVQGPATAKALLTVRVPASNLDATRDVRW